MKNFSASILFVLLALVSQFSSAQTIRRVNNNGVTGTNIYATLQLAHDAAANGDIIQVEPSTTAYGTLTCTKQLTIVGPGYLLGENQPPALQANVIPATISSINFNSGSAGTTVSGLSSNNYFYISTNNITIQRCYLPGGYIYLGYTLVTNGAVIRQNYCLGVQESSASTNSLITNNIFLNGSVSLAGIANTGEFSNNTIVNTTVSLNNFTVRSNYFNNGFTPTANTNWAFNMFTNATLPTGGTASNNTANVPLASVFVLSPGSQFDGWYRLKTGTNPAVGAGQGGVDVGATGSATGYGYHFGGLPAIPAIYQLNQNVVGNSLNVTLGTRSNN
ncbi:MAG: hypothetical protein JWR44_1865 [Hymenobacter sp.]|jgi:hypothetical protein|nr:hypothetical protein [Hymenobacter sp.]